MKQPTRRLLAAAWLLAALSATARGAVWKATGDIGFAHFDAEMRDSSDPMIVFLRVENHSTLESLKVPLDFVQMTDSQNHAIRPVSADEVASDLLEQLRQLLPRHAAEIDALLGDIRADFPQQKLVQVYADLKKYMQQGRPITWRTGLENWLLAKRESTAQDVAQANRIIEEIGTLSQNYLWPTEIAPAGNSTGVVYFRKTSSLPVNIFFHINKDFIGTQMRITASGDGKQ